MPETPLRYSTDVARATRLAADGGDSEAVHGVTVATDPNKRRIVGVSERDLTGGKTAPKLLGVTAVSLSYDGQPSYRTVLFDVEDQRMADGIDANATRTLMDIGSGYDRVASTVLDKAHGLRYADAYREIRDGVFGCTLGGVLIVEDDDPQNIRRGIFMSNAYDTWLDQFESTRVARLGQRAGVLLSRKVREARSGGVDLVEARKQNAFGYILSKAIKRGDPIVVPAQVELQTSS